MKKLLIVFCALAVGTGFMACATGDVSSKMSYYHGQTIPDQFFKILRSSAEEVVFEITVDFKVIHMYHILIDENGKPVSEGWYTTRKTGQSYTAAMKPKPGMVFQAGKKYRLCIGSESPEKVFITTSSYPCAADYEFTLEIK
jgi:hypothetical protein